MSREDITEDTASHGAVRAAADAASGWNGSLELWRPSSHTGEPCRPEFKARLLAARAMHEARAAEQRKRGQCL